MRLSGRLCFAGVVMFFTGTILAATNSPSPPKRPLAAKEEAPPAAKEGTILAAPTGRETVHDLKAWEPQLAQARQQIELLQLFCALTAFGGATINLPPASQHIPLENDPNTKGVAKAGISFEIKELKLKDVILDYAQEPEWFEDKPAFPARIRFANIGFVVYAKTPVGTIPVNVSFRKGTMPLAFACTNEGYTIHVIPEPRKAEAQIDDVRIDLGGANKGRILSAIFGKQVAQAVLQYGVGQSFKLDKNALMGNKGGNPLPGVLEQVLK